MKIITALRQKVGIYTKEEVIKVANGSYELGLEMGKKISQEESVKNLGQKLDSLFASVKKNELGK